MTKISINGGKRHLAALKMLALVSSSLASGMLVSAPAHAQDYTQVNATGRVQSTDGKAIAGATVTISSDGQGFSRSVVTDGTGNFRIAALPQGNYSFEISADGFDTYKEAAISLTGRGSANAFTLSPAGTAASSDIVVTAGRRQVVDFDRNTTGIVINLGEFATRVPVARDISSVIQLSPGTTQGDAAFNTRGDGAGGSLTNISGASVAENAFFLNGLNITNFRTGLGAVAVPFDLYQSVEVKNGALAPEYGRLTGGLVNAVTKSGSNTFHGSLTFNWEPNDLRNSAPNTLTRDEDSRIVDRKDFIAQLSGPVIKDHLFFYALYQSRDTKSAFGVTALPANTPPDITRVIGSQYIQDTANSPFWAAKVDAVITDGQRLEFTIFDTRNLTIRDVFGTSSSTPRYNPVTNAPGGYNSTTAFRSGGVNYVARYTGSFTDWLTVSGAYGRNRDRDTTESTSSFSSVLDTRGGNSNSIGNPTANAALNADEREFYRGDVDLFFNLFGSHHVRGGYDNENLATTIVTQSYGNGQITLVDGTPADQFGITTGTYAQVRFFRNGGTFNSRNEAFYIQDSWTLFDNRLNLNVGVRNDRFSNKNIDGLTYFSTGNQWGPRLSASFDPVGDGKSKLYGSFSRYFFPIAASTNNRLGGAELDQNRFFRFSGLDSNNQPILTTQLTPTDGAPCIVGTGSCVITSDGTAGDTRTLISSTLKAQSLDEYIIGVERRFGSKIRINLFGTWRDLNASLEDAAINGAVVRFCADNNIAGCAAPFGPNTNQQYILLNPGSAATTLLDRNINGEATPRTITLTPTQLGLNRAQRYYRAITLQAAREFDGVWSADFSYTYSRLDGNTEGGVRSDGNGQADTGATVDFDFAGLGDGTYGLLPNHRRHNIKAFGSYQLFDWLNLGGNLSITSPKVFGCLGTVPVSRDAGAATYGANGTYCNLNPDGSVRTVPAAAGEVLPPRQIVQRGTGPSGSWIAQLNLDAAIKVPSKLFDATVRISVFNVLNTSGVTDIEERGTLSSGSPRRDYGTVTGYQAPRSVRIQLGVGF